MLFEKIHTRTKVYNLVAVKQNVSDSWKCGVSCCTHTKIPKQKFLGVLPTEFLPFVTVCVHFIYLFIYICIFATGNIKTSKRKINTTFIKWLLLLSIFANTTWKTLQNAFINNQFYLFLFIFFFWWAEVLRERGRCRVAQITF